MNYSYSISHFSWSPQAVPKKLINGLSQKISSASKIIDRVIDGFSNNKVRIILHICYHSIFTFCIRRLCLGFSNTSHVDSLYRFRKPVVNWVKTYVCIKKDNNSKENNIKIQYANEFIKKLGMGSTKTCVY